MGNRAVITTECQNASKSENVGLYLHWNGGRDSVEAFLAYCKLKGHRPPETDGYGWARLSQVVGNYIGGTTSIGINTCKRLDCDNFDNGVYIIKDWEIVDRQYAPRFEQREYPLHEMLHEMLTEINNRQPEAEKLKQEVIDKYCSGKEKETGFDMTR